MVENISLASLGQLSCFCPLPASWAPLIHRAVWKAERSLALCNTAQQQLNSHCSKRGCPHKGKTNHQNRHYKGNDHYSNGKKDNQQHRNLLQKTAVSHHQHIKLGMQLLIHATQHTTWYLLPNAPTNNPDLSLVPQSEEGGPVPFFYCNLTAGTTMAGNRSGQRRASPDTSHNHCPHFTGTRDPSASGGEGCNSNSDA